MGRNKNMSVYEDLLSQYNTLKAVENEKVTNANNKIAAAKEKIEKNKALMEEATKRGDMDIYAELNADNAKNTEIIKFFERVLAAEKQNGAITPEAARDLYNKADVEMAVIKSNYNKSMLEAIKPLIELSNDTYKKLYLLEMAKSKISINLEHKHCAIGAVTLDLHMMSKLDRLLQCNDYKKLSPDVKGEEKYEYKQYDWQAPARAEIAKEAARWT